MKYFISEKIKEEISEIKKEHGVEFILPQVSGISPKFINQNIDSIIFSFDDEKPCLIIPSRKLSFYLLEAFFLELSWKKRVLLQLTNIFNNFKKENNI